MSMPERNRPRSRHGGTAPEGSAMPASGRRPTSRDRSEARKQALNSLRVQISSAMTITELNETYSGLLSSLDRTLPLIGLQMTMSAPDWKAEAGSVLAVAYKEAYSHIGPPLAARLADELGRNVEKHFKPIQHQDIPNSDFESLVEKLLDQLERDEKKLVPHSDFRNDDQLNEIHAAMKRELNEVIDIENDVKSDSADIRDRRYTESGPGTSSFYSHASYTSRLEELRQALDQRARNIVQGRIDPYNPVYNAAAWRERCRETYELVLERYKYGELTREQAARALERERQALGATAHVAWRPRHERNIHDEQDARQRLKHAVDEALHSYKDALQQLKDKTSPRHSASLPELHDGVRRGTGYIPGDVDKLFDRRDSTYPQKPRGIISQSDPMALTLPQGAPSHKRSSPSKRQHYAGDGGNEPLIRVPGRPTSQTSQRSAHSLVDAHRQSQGSVAAPNLPKSDLQSERPYHIGRKEVRHPSGRTSASAGIARHAASPSNFRASSAPVSLQDPWGSRVPSQATTQASQNSPSSRHSSTTPGRGSRASNGAATQIPMNSARERNSAFLQYDPHVNGSPSAVGVRHSSRHSVTTSPPRPARSSPPTFASTEPDSMQAYNAATRQLSDLIKGLPKAFSECRNVTELNELWQSAYGAALRLRDKHLSKALLRSRSPVSVRKMAGSWTWVTCEKDMVEAYETRFIDLAEGARKYHETRIRAVAASWRAGVKTDQSKKGRRDAAHRGLRELGVIQRAFERDLREPSSLRKMLGADRVTMDLLGTRDDLRNLHDSVDSMMKTDRQDAHMHLKLPVLRFLSKVLPKRGSRPDKRSRRPIHSERAYEKHEQSRAKAKADGRMYTRRMSRL